MYWQLQATPSSPNSPQSLQQGGQTIKLLMIDDETGDLYCGGVNKTETWTPTGGSGLSLVVPTPTADARVFTLPQVPKVLMLFLGGLLQTAGADNDFVLNAAIITFNYTPADGASIQAVIG